MDPTDEIFLNEYTGPSTVRLGTERLDCDNLDGLTEKWEDPNRPTFLTVLLRFFGNIFVDCFRAIFS
ncbi:uncharacterized protein LOC111594290 [Drosophila hydei]|uniref:Uncharacterized protein LOC111594290 n=1 Tax=Drosophila hydei TaxID=7224 RepID=A0A6J1LB91_DROHY|nr:uncharacterized protein LOC111594290 [Drosophila hydei]